MITVWREEELLIVWPPISMCLVPVTYAIDPYYFSFCHNHLQAKLSTEDCILAIDLDNLSILWLQMEGGIKQMGAKQM